MLNLSMSFEIIYSSISQGKKQNARSNLAWCKPCTRLQLRCRVFRSILYVSAVSVTLLEKDVLLAAHSPDDGDRAIVCSIVPCCLNMSAQWARACSAEWGMIQGTSA